MTRLLFSLLVLFAVLEPARAQTLNASGFRIEWQVANRFRLFKDQAFFKLHENGWRQYLLHARQQSIPEDEVFDLVSRTSVLGTEHVLNDRNIAFTRHLRRNFDWRGWAASGIDRTCYDGKERRYTACGTIDDYLTPKSHRIEMWLSAAAGEAVPADRICDWSINGEVVARVGCGERVSGAKIALPYPGGADISVSVAGELPIVVAARVKDLLIASLGDSFASGEGNPDEPVAFDDKRRFRNFYPARKQNNQGGSASWTDRLCHRSLYGQHLRAALQIAIENPKASITFLDYSCSGASIEAGILGPQEYVERVSDADPNAGIVARPITGGNRDFAHLFMLRDLCAVKPNYSRGLWRCKGGQYRRSLDFLFLSVGGNDLGFASMVAWATLRDSTSADIAKFFGATVSANQFASRMKKDLPEAYGKLAKALEETVPLYSAADRQFDPGRIILTGYPQLVNDENGSLCKASDGSDAAADQFVANQSLDLFSSWLEVRQSRLKAVTAQFSALHRRMKELALDHGWTFAGRAFGDGMFDRHGFCARDRDAVSEATEMLMMPCWGTAERETQTCQTDLSSTTKRNWRPYNPATQNFPYALRQRWVRTFNDAYMVMNQKVVDRAGRIDEKASAAVFSETTGALHPSAEGHAAMADALMLTIRPMIAEMLAEEQVPELYQPY
jgi:lysophospholipase L1-like esterase